MILAGIAYYTKQAAFIAKHILLNRMIPLFFSYGKIVPPSLGNYHDSISTFISLFDLARAWTATIIKIVLHPHKDLPY
jgi:hypothetical protein